MSQDQRDSTAGHGPRDRREVPFIDPDQLPAKGDSLAEAEASSFARGDYLDRQRKIGDHQRSERVREHLAQGVIAGLWVAIVAVILMGLGWAYHLITPIRWHFLVEEQLETIQTILFGGGVGAFISNYLRKILD